MKNRFLIVTLTCLVAVMYAVSFAYAIPQCEIVQSSIPWNPNNQSTWISGTYRLTIECRYNGSLVAGYQAQFAISLMEGASWENNIATLITYSTPTDSNGIAYINVPLIHLQKPDGKYIHICPFDDIQCTGGVILSSQVAQTNSSPVSSLTTLSTTGCTNTNTVPGCCETTTMITCSNTVFKYCFLTTQAQCTEGTTNPDACTTITTTFKPNGICNYCSGACEPQTLITLSSFAAKPGNKSVTLNWTTESELDNAGFNLYRSESENGQYTKINTSLISAKGSSTEGASYGFVDNDVKNGRTYYYKLEDIDLNGISTMHGPVIATPRWIIGIFGK